MEETVVFIDEGFLDKLSKLFGNGIRLKFDKFEFARRIAEKQNLICKRLFYYTAPPFQGTPPTKIEKKLKEGYDKFVSSLSANKSISVREGRCQRILNSNGEMEYNQKGVDVLLTIDLSHIKEDFPEVKKVILISSDTDFCPVIRDIKKREGTEVILYTYFDRKRRSKFCLSNELISCCSKCFKITKQDFDNAPLI